MLQLALQALDDMKATHVRTIDVRAMTPITDYMVICTGTSARHVQSLADSVLMAAKDNGTPAAGVEGMQEGEWVLVDLGEVVVHVMQAQARAFYQLEKLWGFAPEAADEDSSAPGA